MYAKHTTRTPCHTHTHTYRRELSYEYENHFHRVKILFNLQIFAVGFLGNAISMQIHLIVLGFRGRPLNALYVTLL